VSSSVVVELGVLVPFVGVVIVVFCVIVKWGGGNLGIGISGDLGDTIDAFVFGFGLLGACVKVHNDVDAWQMFECGY